MHAQTTRSSNVPDPSHTDPMLVGMTEAARMIGVSARTLWSMANAGELPTVRIRRRVLFNVAALREWVDARTEGGAA